MSVSLDNLGKRLTQGSAVNRYDRDFPCNFRSRPNHCHARPLQGCALRFRPICHVSNRSVPMVAATNAVSPSITFHLGISELGSLDDLLGRRARLDGRLLSVTSNIGTVSDAAVGYHLLPCVPPPLRQFAVRREGLCVFVSTFCFIAHRLPEVLSGVNRSLLRTLSYLAGMVSVSLE